MDKTASGSTCRHSRIICISFSSNEYRIVNDPAKFRAYLDAMIEQFPELFPAEITVGYQMKDIRKSKKLSIVIRRISVLKTDLGDGVSLIA